MTEAEFQFIYESDNGLRRDLVRELGGRWSNGKRENSMPTLAAPVLVLGGLCLRRAVSPTIQGQPRRERRRSPLLPAALVTPRAGKAL